MQYQQNDSNWAYGLFIALLLLWLWPKKTPPNKQKNPHIILQLLSVWVNLLWQFSKAYSIISTGPRRKAGVIFNNTAAIKATDAHQEMWDAKKEKKEKKKEYTDMTAKSQRQWDKGNWAPRTENNYTVTRKPSTTHKQKQNTLLVCISNIWWHIFFLLACCVDALELNNRFIKWISEDLSWRHCFFPHHRGDREQKTKH